MSIELCLSACPRAMRMAQVTIKHFIAVCNDIGSDVGGSSSFLWLSGKSFDNHLFYEQ